MIGEVIQLLLFIFNINKSPLNRENVITVSLLSYNSIPIESDRGELLSHKAESPGAVPEADGGQSSARDRGDFHS